MKTKFKDLLLYSLATIGIVALFISATQPQQTTSTVPESHVWEGHVANSGTVGYNYFYSLNKETGEVRLSVRNDKSGTNGLRQYKAQARSFGQK